jgi:hypothetical protein
VHDPKPNCVIVFTGLPRTGKSTLAEYVARSLHAPAFAGDWLMGAFPPLTADHLRTDAVNPLDDNIQHVLDQIRNLPQYSA